MAGISASHKPAYCPVSSAIQPLRASTRFSVARYFGLAPLRESKTGQLVGSACAGMSSVATARKIDAAMTETNKHNKHGAASHDQTH